VVAFAVSLALHAGFAAALFAALAASERRAAEPVRLFFIDAVVGLPATGAARAGGAASESVRMPAPSAPEPAPGPETADRPRETAAAERTTSRPPPVKPRLVAPPKRTEEPPPATPQQREEQAERRGRPDTRPDAAPTVHRDLGPEPASRGDDRAGALARRGDVGAGRDGPGGPRDGRIYAAGAIPVPPILVKREVPVYPREARRRQVEGVVVIEAVVDREGRVEADSIAVRESVALLDAAAVEAVGRWRFRPGRDRDGAAVRVLLEIPIRFVLR
jgi:protein TonB